MCSGLDLSFAVGHHALTAGSILAGQEVGLTDDQVARWRMRYASLLASAGVDAKLTEDVTQDEDQADVRRRLSLVFADRPDVERIRLRVNGREIGVATRAKVMRDPGHAGATDTPFDPGAGDGATLPGHPSQFRAVSFACESAGCRAGELRSFYDERYVPQCPRHGAMKVHP